MLKQILLKQLYEIGPRSYNFSNLIDTKLALVIMFVMNTHDNISVII